VDLSPSWIGLLCLLDVLFKYIGVFDHNFIAILDFSVQSSGTMWSRDAFLALRSINVQLDEQVRRTVKRLQCLRRGCRAGLRVRQRTNCRTVIETDTPWKIPVISTNRHLLANSLPSPTSFHGARSVLRKISRQQASPVKLGVFNARSVSTSGKSQIIASRVKDLHLSVVGLVETWHDGRDTPSLVACATSTQSERQQDLPNTRARRCLSATSRSTSRAARQHYTVHDV